MNKLLYKGMFTVVISLFFTVLYINYLLFFPVKTLTENATVVTKQIHAGDLFIYKVDYCKYTKVGATVYRTFHKTDESYLEAFPAVQTITVMGCGTVEIPLQTFKTTRTGEYYLLVTVIFQVNPLRQEQVVFRTDDFTIN